MSDLNLKKVFQRKKVVDIQTLLSLSEGRSRRSLFRDLANLEYISSYSHAGKFYTIPSIPSFDLNGLWHYGKVSFSKYGTLKTTLRIFVQESKSGFTHKELRELLRISVQNSLNDLIKCELIGREMLDDLFLYVSCHKEVAAKQIAQRREQTTIRTLDTNTTIEVLLELFHSEDWCPESISERLKIKNIVVSSLEIKNVLLQYNIKKKNST